VVESKERFSDYAHVTFKRRLDDLADELAATGLKPEAARFPGSYRIMRSKLQKLANGFADRRAARFAVTRYGTAGAFQSRGGQSSGTCVDFPPPSDPSNVMNGSRRMFSIGETGICDCRNAQRSIVMCVKSVITHVDLTVLRARFLVILSREDGEGPHDFTASRKVFVRSNKPCWRSLLPHCGIRDDKPVLRYPDEKFSARETGTIAYFMADFVAEGRTTGLACAITPRATTSQNARTRSLFYHSGEDKAVCGNRESNSDGISRFDCKEAIGPPSIWLPSKPLRRPVTLREIKSHSS